jgi:molecular chaperone Hsp33
MNGPLPKPFVDRVQPFSLETASVRGRFVRLGPACEQILAPHEYPKEVGTLMGETLALAVVLATALKYNGIFTLQTQSDGPVGLMVADLTSDGAMRGYARYRPDSLGSAGGGEAMGPVPRLLGAGHLAFTVDRGPESDRYQGVTALEGATMADCAHTYFRTSEQLETAIRLTADPSRPDGAAAAALMIQRLPGQDRGRLDPEESEEAWRNAVVLTSSVTDDEMLDPGLDANTLLMRLYHEPGVRVYRTKPIHHACRCSRERVTSTLAAFPRAELDELRDENGNLSVQCEFCQTEFIVDDDDLDAIARS